MKPDLVRIAVKVCPRCGAETPMFSGPIAHYRDCPRNPANSDQTTPRNPPQPSATVESNRPKED